MMIVTFSFLISTKPLTRWSIPSSLTVLENVVLVHTPVKLCQLFMLTVAMGLLKDSTLRVRQGCPVSVYLFLIVTQAFCHYVKSSHTEDIQIVGRNILLTQLADDSALFLKNALQVKPAIKILNIFSNASSLCLNLNK